jgi:hypothetical protein
LKEVLLNTDTPAEELRFDYQCQTPKSSFSICDLMGNELISGRFIESEHHSIPVHQLGTGLYMLCIIDGDQLIKKRFRKI